MGYDTVVYDVPGKDGIKNAAGIQKPKPITQMTLGELGEYQETQVRPLSRQYGLSNKERQERLRAMGFKDDPGSTGVGRYQFERSTLADIAQKEFGPEWKAQKFTPEIQDQLARRLWNDVKGDEARAKNTWAAVANLRSSTPSPVSTPTLTPTSGSNDVKGAVLMRTSGSGIIPAFATTGLGVGAAAVGALSNVLGGASNAVVGAQDTPTGTLMHVSRWNLLAKNRGKSSAKSLKRRLAGGPRYLGPSIRFKDLRKNIAEQIIMSESKEKIDEGVSQFFSLNPQSNQSLAQDAIEMGLGFIPGVGQALAARDFERARRVGDKAGMAMAASSVVPLARVGNKSLEIIKRASKEAEDLFHAMKKIGVSDDDIWKSTHGKVPGGGVYQHPQTGDIVQEIPGTVKLKPEFRKNFEKTRGLIQQFRNRRNYETKKFGDVFDAPELYDQIPEIKNSAFDVNKLPEIIPNFISRRLSMGVYQPAWRSNPASMKASVGDTKDLEMLGSHEAAHYVADRNNLPRGSTSDFHAHNMNWDSMTRSQKASAIYKKDSPFHRYERDPGEIDARVSSQRNVTPDEYRRNVNPRHDYADEYERTTGKPLITPFYKTKE